MLHRLVYSFLGSATSSAPARVRLQGEANKVVYAPNPLFSNLVRPGLEQLPQASHQRWRVSKPEQLTRLDLRLSGIENLDGLATFTGLTALRLSADKVATWSNSAKL